MVALAVGLIIGFVLAMPPGPVAVTAIRLGFDKGLRHSMSAALGTGILDVIYCMIAIFATSAAVEYAKSVAANNPLIMLAFQSLVVVILIAFGILQFKVKDHIAVPDEQNLKSKSIFKNFSHKGPFLLGVAVALANVANPTFLPSLAYVTMNVHSFGFFANTWENNVVFSLGFGLGNFLWLYTIVKVLLYYRSRMSPQFYQRIHQFAGFTLISFGTILGYRIITVTHWPEVIRIVLAF